MNRLKGKFWLDRDDLIDDVRAVGYEVYEINDEYMTIVPVDSEDEMDIEIVYLNVSGNTISIA